MNGRSDDDMPLLRFKHERFKHERFKHERFKWDKTGKGSTDVAEYFEILGME